MNAFRHQPAFPLFATLLIFGVGCKPRQFNANPEEFANARQGSGTPYSLDLSEAAREVGLPAEAIQVVRRPLQDIPEDDDPTVRFNLEISFQLTTESQFSALRKRYAAWAKAQPTQSFRGPGSYRLETFLPPVIQAAYGKRFQSSQQRPFHLPRAVAEAFPPGAIIPNVIQFFTNCWTTVYSTMYASLSADPATQLTFPVFMVNSAVEKVLANNTYFTKVDSAGRANAMAKQRALRAGDTVLVYGAAAVTNGKRSILHAAIKIDHNLWYEKTANTDDVAYRFVTFEDILAKYAGYEPTYEFRRPTGTELPHPSAVFSVAAMYGPKNAFAQAPAVLKSFISENPWPSDPYGYLGFGMMDVRAQRGDAATPARFEPKAFEARTYQLPGEANRPIEFSDLLIQGHDLTYAQEVRQAALYKLVSGTGPNKFTPEGDVSRAQSAAILINLVNRFPEAKVDVRSGQAPFSDVPATHWAAGHVAAARQLGIVAGGNAFRPEATVTRAELAAMMLKTAAHVRQKLGLSGALPEIQPNDYGSGAEDLENHWAKDVMDSLRRYCGAASVSMQGRDAMANLMRPDGPAKRGYTAASALRLYHCMARERLGLE